MAQVSRPTERIAVLIPAFQPDESLTQLVSSLLALEFGAIVVVNDGSGARYDPIFEKLGPAPSVRLLRHPVNLGKGRALKTGLRYFLDHLADFDGVVTCDADGQHDAADVWSTAQRVHGVPDKLVMGVRRFRGSIPLRSRLGNAITKHVFAFLTGSTLGDTQCGLRGIPRKLIPRCLQLAGDRYEFEMNVLADATRSCGVAEVPIDTIYINGNRSSHFRPFRDSMQIYLVLARFYLLSLIAAILELALFAVVFSTTNSLLASFVCGRISPIANLFYNRHGFPSWTRE